MILNSRANSFYFVFPQDFFDKRVVEKYERYYKRMPIPYETIGAFMNSTIQSVSFPNMTIPSVTQVRPLGKTQNYKSAKPIQDQFNQEFNITFKTVEGFLNYWIMLDNIISFLDFRNDYDRNFKEDLVLRLLDNQGNILTSVFFKQVLITSLSELNLSYSSNNPTFNSFTVGFKCNLIDIKLEVG